MIIWDKIVFGGGGGGGWYFNRGMVVENCCDGIGQK